MLFFFMATINEIKELRELSGADFNTCNRYLLRTNNNIKAAYAQMKRDGVAK